MEQKLKLDVQFIHTINFAMQQNYVPIVRKLIVTNQTDADLHDVRISITFEPEFAKKYEVVISLLEPEQPMELAPVPVVLNSEYLLSLTEKMIGSIQIEAMIEEELLDNVTSQIELLSYDEWPGVTIMPELLTAFVTPNHPMISEVLSEASVYLNQWTKSPSFTGYQRKNPNAVLQQMAAIYAALQARKIAYIVPPASYERTGQRIRLAHVVLEQKQGTCLDLAVLFASCLEAAGLNPLVILKRGHAVAGCFLEEETFSEYIQDDHAAITKRMADGIDELSVIECTDFVAEKYIEFDDSCEHGKAALAEAEEFLLAVDVQRSRAGGIRPIPVRIEEAGAFKTVEYGTDRQDKITDAPKEKEVTEPLADTEEVTVGKQQIWERKLLDLSLRNALLNFRVTRSNVQLMCPNLSELEDELSKGEDFKVLACPNDFKESIRDSKIYEIENSKDIIRSITEFEFKNKRIRTFLDESPLEQSLKYIHRKAKISLEENGANTLYLAIGFLRWYESELSEKPRYAPLILLPVDIIKKVVERTYVIRLRDEDPQINVTLLELLRQDFGITIPGLDPLPQDEHGINLNLVFQTVRKAIMEKKRWDIEELTFLGLFSFNQFILWNDLRNRTEDIIKNPVVSSLLADRLLWEPMKDCLNADELDEKLIPSEMAIPLSADSSQLTAICAAAKGQSFVLHGPPGTGKSQTITNMIANALYQGKSVLFVSEKMAALSVVQKRLNKIGLAPFCLELHSNKAQKRAVLDQLDRTLEIGQLKKPEDYEACAKKLHSLREELNQVMKEIHQKRSYGKSLFDAISDYENYLSYQGKVKFDTDRIAQMNESTDTEWKELLRKLEVAGKEAGGIRNTPFALFESRTYSMELRNQIIEVLTEYDHLIEKIYLLADRIAAEYGMHRHQSRAYIDALLTMNTNMLQAEEIIVPALKNKNLAFKDEAIRKLLGQGQRMQSLRKQIREQYEDGIFSYQVKKAKETLEESEKLWFFPKFMKQNQLLKELKAFAKQPKELKKTALTEIYEILEEYHEKKNQVDQAEDDCKKQLGIFEQIVANPEEVDFDCVAAHYEHTYALQSALHCILTSPEEYEEVYEKLIPYCRNLTGFAENSRQLADEYEALHVQLLKLEETLSETYEIKIEKLLKEPLWDVAIRRQIAAWLKNMDGLRSYTAFLKTKDEIQNSGPAELLELIHSGELTEEELLPCYISNISYAMIRYTMNESETLTDFNGAIFEEKIQNYKEAIHQFETLTIQELVAVLSEKIPSTNGNAAASSELGILQKAVRSGRRVQSIRKLFDSIPTLLRRLCPCMLMSPISVAQYIDPSFPKFDLVIFDEASQLPTSVAAGAIARGNSVVVVGDPKQLPPTSFFSTNHVDEENDEMGDLESLLDDCLALSMPKEHLRWHYRSRHESLIAYSNRQYYDNQLYTFPSPNDLISQVRFIPVKGFYDKGNTKQNRAEAEAVVAEIVRRLSDEKLRKDSIGVVTFSVAQQILIDDLLNEQYRQYPYLEQFNMENEEPLFIKNLENVQGDERDVILFSIGYGPDRDGKVSMNFGPINQEGGWRRLNVAISRSRKQMLVYSTLQPEQIDLSRTRSEGVAGLKGFLEYAKNGKQVLTVKNGTQTYRNHAIEELIAKRIRHMGYDVKCNIGCSAYQIDIGIVDPQNPQSYLLGIIFDGENYKLAGTARDRNILQPAILEGLGWRILRVWVLDWLDSPDRVISKIRTELERILEHRDQVTVENDQPYIPQDTFADETTQPEAINMTAAAEDTSALEEEEQVVLSGITFQKEDEKENPYETLYHNVVLKIQGTADQFYEASNTRKILVMVKEVVGAEAPISKKMLFKKVLAAWQISRSGGKIEFIMDMVLRSMETKTTESGDVTFYWRKDQEPTEYMEYRIPAEGEEKRAMDDICPEEISNAIRTIVLEQIGLSRIDLIRETAKVFGYSRLGNTIEASVNSGIEQALLRGYVQVSEDGEHITLPQ